jgi:hypothetical protein
LSTVYVRACSVAGSRASPAAHSLLELCKLRDSSTNGSSWNLHLLALAQVERLDKKGPIWNASFFALTALVLVWFQIAVLMCVLSRTTKHPGRPFRRGCLHMRKGDGTMIWARHEQAWRRDMSTSSFPDSPFYPNLTLPANPSRCCSAGRARTIQRIGRFTSLKSCLHTYGDALPSYFLYYLIGKCPVKSSSIYRRAGSQAMVGRSIAVLTQVPDIA